MNHITQQLRWVRRAGRVMLVIQRLCQWTTVMAAVVIVLVTADYLLRLPGMMRLIVGVAVAASAGWWLIERMRRAAGFRPTLADLALRAERLYPPLAGTLGSAVEFALYAERYSQPPATAAMARAAIDEAQRHAEGFPLRRLIDPSRTLRLAVAAMAVLVVLGALAVMSPAYATIAARRWLTPLGEAQWPRRVDVENITDAEVWPIDTALPLSAAVLKGDHDGLRVWVHYRLRRGQESGTWHHALMSRLTPDRAAEAGNYETLVDLGSLVSPGEQEATLEYRFVAGDDRTTTAQVRLAARPTAIAVTARMQPPSYAAGLVDPQTVHLHEQAGPVAAAAALQHSRVEWELRFNKPLPLTDVADLLPGLHIPFDVLTPGDGAESDRLVIAFTLTDTVQTTLQLMDHHGLRSPGVRRYRLEAIEDRPPNVALLEPAADEAVLPTAVVPIESAAQDDVAVSSLALEAAVTDEPVMLAQATGRRANMTLRHELDLTAMRVVPGDNVTLTAVARDAYFEDADRPAVRSGQRRLRIIDDTQLVQQLRADLATVRQQAIRMERTQRRLIEAPNPTDTLADQAQLTRRLGVQRNLVERLADRARRNRLQEPALDELLSQADRLLDDAQRRSAAAEPLLEQDTDAARAEQAAARRAMQELVDLLDQGRDALTLQLALRGLRTQQDQLAQETRELLPRTVGRAMEDLSPPLREQVQRLAERQRQLRVAAEQLVRDMESSAQSLSRQSTDDQDRAAAEALAEAAAIARRQGLEQDMQEASEQVGRNQLSQAGQQQADAQRTLAQMAEAVGSQQQRQAEMLRRRLMELSQLLERLIERQQAQLDELDAAQDVESLLRLAPPMALLRRATLGAEDMAAQSPQTQPLTDPIGRAINEQGRAVTALRDTARPDAADAEQAALAHLREALEGVRQEQRRQRTEQAQQDRDRLRREYERLAARQEELNQAVAALLDEPSLDRRQRADLRAGEQAQAAIRTDAELLWSDVGQTLIFNRLHERIDESARRVERQLAGGSTDRTIADDQTAIARALRLMAEALAQQTRSEQQFDSPPGGGGGGGGGEGQAPGSDQAVPPRAELRLLRELQQYIYDTTRRIDESQPGREALMRLADEQSELATLGERLMEQARQQAEGGR